MVKHCHIPRREIAKDILEYCKEKKKRFFVSKYAAGKIMNLDERRTYSPRELSAGMNYLHKKKVMTPVSNSRWKVESYEMED